MGMKLSQAEIDRLCATPGAVVISARGLVAPAIPPALPTPARPAPATKKPRNKYGAIRAEYGGVMYASKSEAARAKRLDELQASGVIRFWIGQPKFRLGVPENVYVSDFLVVTAEGNVRVEDVKGRETAKFRRDKKLWAAYGPCDLIVITGGKVAETITPKGPSA